MPKKTAQNNYFYAVGRRKSSVATVKLFLSEGANTVNGRPVDKYFGQSTLQLDLARPFSGLKSKHSFTAKLSGGGINGQKEALILALSRAVQKTDPALTSVLRGAGPLTVDSRVRQKRMVGTGGKARRQKQSPKR